MAEMVVWTRELALGYPKHPPLLACDSGAGSGSSRSPTGRTILLAVVTRVGRHLPRHRARAPNGSTREKLAAVPFLLAAIPFYNFLGLKFDQNSVLIPLWALAMWAMLRALDTRHLGWAALAGLAAAAAMLTKYWSAFLLVALALAALFHRRRDAISAPRAPWVTAGVFLAVLSRRMSGGWCASNFPPITWVTTRRVAASSRRYARARSREYLGGTAAYAGAALSALVLSSCGRRAPRSPMAWLPRDERRIAAILFWTPLLLPLRAGADQPASACCRCGTRRRSICCP